MIDCTIGILGGGQLAKMLIQAASTYGFRTVVYCPPGDNPAIEIATDYILDRYDSKKNLERFAKMADVITSEFENVPASTLRFLERLGTPVFPRANVFKIAQDRFLEKSLARKLGIAVPSFWKVEEIDSSQDFLFPAILKTRKNGYDGKGQAVVSNLRELEKAWEKFGKISSILEEKVDFECEVSVIASCNSSKDIVFFPTVENVHREGILRETYFPIREVADKKRRFDVKKVIHDSQKIASALAEELEVVGLLAVEMFVMPCGKVLFNEMAPRPHNSGHWTIDACTSSQFDHLVRILAGMRRPSIAPHSHAKMINLIGEQVHKMDSCLEDPRAKIHIYGKEDVKAGRKMGHVTYIGADSFSRQL